MTRLTKLEVALLLVPMDLVCTLVAYGADQAMIWTGADPVDTAAFFFAAGRQVGELRDRAWAKEHDQCG